MEILGIYRVGDRTSLLLPLELHFFIWILLFKTQLDEYVEKSLFQMANCYLLEVNGYKWQQFYEELRKRQTLGANHQTQSMWPSKQSTGSWVTEAQKAAVSSLGLNHLPCVWACNTLERSCKWTNGTWWSLLPSGF